MSNDNEYEHGEYEDECGHCEALNLRARIAHAALEPTLPGSTD